MANDIDFLLGVWHPMDFRSDLDPLGGNGFKESD
jgi:hypothetical protein